MGCRKSNRNYFHKREDGRHKPFNYTYAEFLSNYPRSMYHKANSSLRAASTSVGGNPVSADNQQSPTRSQ